VRTSMILPPNLYRNMNTVRILKIGGGCHAAWTKRYTARPDAAKSHLFCDQVRDGAASDESPYFCVA
jgi:hypothetical protein